MVIDSIKDLLDDWPKILFKFCSLLQSLFFHCQPLLEAFQSFLNDVIHQTESVEFAVWNPSQ